MPRWLVRLATPVVWRIPGHASRKLYGFARAEQGSRIDLLAAAHGTTSRARQALYLKHALDETRHAQLFWRRANELRASDARAGGWPAPQADTEELWARLGEARFLAFVHRGEARGRGQFEVYARHFARRGDARTAALFAGILIDEARHERYTRALLVELVGGEAAARKALRWAAAWEAWRTWRRLGRWLAGVLFAVTISCVYVVAGMVAAVAAALGRRSEKARRRRAWSGEGP